MTAPRPEEFTEYFWGRNMNRPKNPIPWKDYPIVAIKNRHQFYNLFEDISIQFVDMPEYSRNMRSNRYKVNASMALNMLLYYISKASFRDQKKYKVTPKVWLDVLNVVTFNETYKYVLVGEKDSTGTRIHYYPIVGPWGNELLSMPLQFEHTSFRKAVALCRKENKTKADSLYLNRSNLELDQKKFKRTPEVQELLKPEYATKNANINEKELHELSSNDSIGLNDITQSEEEIEEEIEKRLNPPMPELNTNIDNISFDDEADVSDFLPPAPDISSITMIDESLLDEELVENINSNSMLTSMLEPSVDERNTSHISERTMKAAEDSLLKDTLREELRKHHEKNANSIDEDTFNKSFLRKLEREDNRYKARQKSGRGYTGAGNYKTGDLREEPGINPDLKPKKSFTNQDDDYLDYAFYGFVREYGTVITDIMKLPLGFDYNSQRRGSSVYIRAIHFKNTFTHITGTKATGRMVLFYSTKEASSTHILEGRKYNTLDAADILQKSVTMYAGDIEDLEAVDLFYNPTILSPYDFRDIVLGNRYSVIWDYFAELNTQAVKGVVGENIESVDSVQTKWVKLDNLDIPLFYDGDDKVATRGMLGIVFMGDYFGGEIETNLVMRVYYNSK